jgi:hypothetical protein
MMELLGCILGGICCVAVMGGLLLLFFVGLLVSGQLVTPAV